jgi:hypothetical protein
MTDEHTDVLAPLRGRGEYIAGIGQSKFRVLDGCTTPLRNLIAECSTPELTLAVAAALNLALSAEAEIARLQADNDALRKALCGVLARRVSKED